MMSMETTSVLESPGEKRSLYPMTKKRNAEQAFNLPPISGKYSGSLTKEQGVLADLQLKLDVDRVRPFAPVLNVISGSVCQRKESKAKWFTASEVIYFRSVDKPKITSVPGGANNDTTIEATLRITLHDGTKMDGSLKITFRLPQDDGKWGGSLRLHLGSDDVTFDDVTRISSFFKEVYLDVDYVEKVIFPEVELKYFYDSPIDMKERKIGVIEALQDAGIELHYEAKKSNKIEDPTPNNPWTNDDMYDVMMNHFDQSEHDLNIWCMIAEKPPDERYMGFSFDKDGARGFGLFTKHKAFKGLDDKSNAYHKHASRRFLHYFVHEIGHSLGLVHPFEMGKPAALSWMNYSWKYDTMYGPGEFYENFRYSFTEAELMVLRHNPSKEYIAVAGSDVVISDYVKIKSIPTASTELDESVDEETLKLSIRTHADSYHVGDLIELEIRLKNDGETPVAIDELLNIESGNLSLYVACPDGTLKISDTFLHYVDTSSLSKSVILQPAGDASGGDRYSQLIRVGEGRRGPVFPVEGKYRVTAIYNGGKRSATSHPVEILIKPATSSDGNKETNIVSVLDGSSHSRFQSVFDQWKTVALKDANYKKTRIPLILALLEECSVHREIREFASAPSGKGKMLTKSSARFGDEDVVRSTDDLVRFYHEQGTKEDNMNYSKLVFARGKIMLKTGSKEKCTAEFNQLLADLVQRRVKYSVIKAASDKWSSMNEAEGETATKSLSKDYLQKRVEEILDWNPTHNMKGQNDLSGIGLENTFSHFRDDHVTMAFKVVRMIFNKFGETNDVSDVLDYADGLQRSYQVNHYVLHWAVEVFIVHCKAAKEHGIMYPTPPDLDKSMHTHAAIFETVRRGEPVESWMNYWRSDADLNYHHRHWHTVYIVGRFIGRDRDFFGSWTTTRPELSRQGELFGYMHTQMLARYDAERESWGLRPVQSWNYNEFESLGFNAGFEFHNDRQNAGFSPRIPSSFPQNAATQFQGFERTYRRAVQSGTLPPIVINGQTYRVPVDANWAGHVIEASSQAWSATLGSIHNNGHGVFSGMTNANGTSYMASTATAMRDPIFYRWHKRVDDLCQLWADGQITELAADAPPVNIDENDVVISRSAVPPEGFANGSSGAFPSDELQTYLGPAEKNFEWDNKISHDSFYYHIRFRRASSSPSGDLNLTVRIFICPADAVNERRRWIEMDKFVYRLLDGENSVMITRPDRHSSVIKRDPGAMQGDVEGSFTSVQAGFCECGWPYHMLLPRGTADGQDWRVCVFISDNNVDGITIRSRCGSMSFCGASGQAYPDRRVMGYPFASPIAVNDVQVSISQAMGVLSNATLAPFVIRSNITVDAPAPMVDVWSPWVQLQVNDGNTDRNSTAGVAIFSTSRITGRMRVLIDDGARTPTRFQRLRVRFQGRGPGGGSYSVSAAHIGTRSGSTNSLTGPSVRITVGGQNSFSVPEVGLITDEVQYGPVSEDIFVTFTLTSPGCFLRASGGRGTSTYIIRNPSGNEATTDSWDGISSVRTSTSVYCIAGVLAPIP